MTDPILIVLILKYGSVQNTIQKWSMAEIELTREEKISISDYLTTSGDIGIATYTLVETGSLRYVDMLLG